MLIIQLVFVSSHQMPVLKILQTLNSCSSISACDGNASSSAISQQGQFESHQEKDQLQQSSHADGSANDRLVSTNTNGTNNQQVSRGSSSLIEIITLSKENCTLTPHGYTIIFRLGAKCLARLLKTQLRRITKQ